MAKAHYELLGDGSTGKAWLQLEGDAFADLFAAWKRLTAKIDALYEQCEFEGWPPQMAKYLDGEISIANQLEAAMWDIQITTLEELKMLAELDATYDDSEHVRPGALGRAVLRILGSPAAPVAAPSALFSPTSVPRIGLSTGS